MAVALGVLVAVVLGTSDFCGGLASRRSSSTAALLGMQVASLVGAVVLLGAGPTPTPTANVLGWSVVSGIGTAIGIACLYRALGAGRMAVAAPVSAVGSGLVPMLWGILRHGERPGAVALSGAALALMAVVLVARSEPDVPEIPEVLGVPMPHDARLASSAGVAAAAVAPDTVNELLLAAGAGLGFGVSLIGFAEAGAAGSFWPVLLARLTGVVLVAGVLLALRAPRTLDRRDRGFAWTAGLLEAVGSAGFILAFRHGLTSVVAPVGALFPATTVVLAHFVLHERIGRVRAAGLVMALVGLVLIAL